MLGDIIKRVKSILPKRKTRDKYSDNVVLNNVLSYIADRYVGVRELLKRTRFVVRSDLQAYAICRSKTIYIRSDLLDRPSLLLYVLQHELIHVRQNIVGVYLMPIEFDCTESICLEEYEAYFVSMLLLLIDAYLSGVDILSDIESCLLNFEVADSVTLHVMMVKQAYKDALDWFKMYKHTIKSHVHMVSWIFSMNI